MKTLVQTLFASALVAISLSSFTANASEKINTATMISTPATGILKVIVKGNAKVTLVQSEKESVKVIDAYNNDRTSIKMVGGTLMINSTEIEPVEITVFVKNLFRIEAFNNATVQTKGAFNLQFLQVILNDKAKANINACTKGLYTMVKGNANLRLTGTSDEHILIRSKVSKLQMEDFACLKTNDTYFETAENTLAKDTVKTVSLHGLKSK